MSSRRAREYWYALEFDRTPRWVSSGECETLRSICQVHRDCGSLILGVVLLRRSFTSFLCVILHWNHSTLSFSYIVLLRRPAMSFRSVVLSFCHVIPLRSFSTGSNAWTGCRFCRAREYWYALEFDRNLTGIDSIDSPICSCGSPILMRFSHAHAVSARRTPMPIDSESTPRSPEYGVHSGSEKEFECSGRIEKADDVPEAEECAMTWKVTPLTPPYAHGGSRILMRFYDAHDVHPCSRRSPMLIRSGSRPRFAEYGVHSGRWKRTELGMKIKTTYLKQKNER